MATTKGTFYKALVLLTVFSLNTVVSFACSLSSLFHNLHHHNSSAKIERHHGHRHDHAKGHTHGKAHVHPHDKAPEERQDHHSNGAKDDCCSNSVVVMQQADKSVSRSIEVPNVFFVASVLTPLYHLSFSEAIPKKAFKHNLRWRHPTTIQDLRIVIQSFQI